MPRGRPAALTAEQRAQAERDLPAAAQLARRDLGSEWEVLQEQSWRGGVRRSYANREEACWCWVQVQPLAPGASTRWLADILTAAAPPRRRVGVLATDEPAGPDWVREQLGQGHSRRELTQGREGRGVTWWLAWWRAAGTAVDGVTVCCVGPEDGGWSWPDVQALGRLADAGLDNRVDSAPIRDT